MSKRQHQDHSYFTKTKKISHASDNKEPVEREVINCDENINAFEWPLNLVQSTTLNA